MKAYKITITDYLNIVEIAKDMGIKEDESMQPALDMYLKIKDLKEIGNYEDMEMVKANLREQGFFKILDLTGKL